MIGTCALYVGIYTRTFNFKVVDVNGAESNVYQKTMDVESAAFIYTDAKKVITDEQSVAGITVPSDENDIELKTS